MPRRPGHPCPGTGHQRCGRMVPAGTPRCPACTPLGYTTAEQKRMAATVNAWRTEHGDWCPGWGRPAHQATPPTNPLTADHVVPISAGGHGGRLTVLCRSCNSRRGAR